MARGEDSIKGIEFSEEDLCLREENVEWRIEEDLQQKEEMRNGNRNEWKRKERK